MKVAWIGVIGTIFGAILGALITVTGQPYFMEWRYGPKEGIVHVEVTSIGSTNVNKHLRDQISNYPVFLTIRHGEGPSAKGITVRLKSKHNLENLKTEREDDLTTIQLSQDKKTLRIDIPELRKNSLNKYQITSLGDPEVTRSVQISQGKLYEDVIKDSWEKSWYESDLFFVIIFVAFISAGIALLFYLSTRIYGKDVTDSFKDKNFILIVLIAVTLSILPFFSSFAIILPLALIGLLTKRISRLEEALASKGLIEK